MFRGDVLEETYDTQISMLEQFDIDIEDYIDNIYDYQDGLLTYQNTYLDVMVELWDDYIGVPRVEGAETVKAELGTLPTAPDAPTLDDEYADVTPSDFECLG